MGARPPRNVAGAAGRRGAAVKQADVQVGATYLCRVSGSLVRVVVVRSETHLHRGRWSTVTMRTLFRVRPE